MISATEEPAPLPEPLVRLLGRTRARILTRLGTPAGTSTLAAELRLEGPRRAILAGVLAAPAALLLPPAWGLLTAGLLGGTLAFLIGRRHARR